eukprot:m.16463 g.16463  ORF g.16463 m.16463 type:complete len:51 (+) comp5707_c0_seq1:2513-2665(+)
MGGTNIHNVRPDLGRPLFHAQALHVYNNLFTIVTRAIALSTITAFSYTLQ